MKFKSPKSIAKGMAKSEVEKATGLKTPKGYAISAAEDATGLKRPKKVVNQAVDEATGLPVSKASKVIKY
jgi:hypothetical protein